MLFSSRIKHLLIRRKISNKHCRLFKGITRCLFKGITRFWKQSQDYHISFKNKTLILKSPPPPIFEKECAKNFKGLDLKTRLNLGKCLVDRKILKELVKPWSKKLSVSLKSHLQKLLNPLTSPQHPVIWLCDNKLDFLLTSQKFSQTKPHPPHKTTTKPF